MDVILPFRIKNEKKFFDCAFKLGFDEMSAHKFLYITHQSDLDIFPKMGDERLNMVLYGWEMCEDYKLKLSEDEWELPEELEAMLKVLVPWSLDIWFSKEWDRCKILSKHTLIHCLNRARGLLMRLPDMMQINWDFLLLYNLTPWQVNYLKSLTVTKEKTLETGAITIETEEQMATSEDISYLKLEQLPLIVLRLVKFFDQSSIDMVKTLCMRVIAAWNKVYYTELESGGSRLPYLPPEDKRCLMLICHIYLMAIYESDDVKGYVIDNMINNIRFYNQGFQASYAMDNMKYTPARFIALTCIHLRLQKREFFDFFIWNSFDTSPVNLFGVVSQAYKSYLLGNLLMELNNMNDDDFAANVALYKRLMNSYVNEREKSEIFMTNELQKLEAQHYAHNIIQCVQNMTDYKSKICKGNRMSNIGNYENTDDFGDDSVGTTKNVVDGEQDAVDQKEANLRVDPIFQNIPNNEDILYYVYDVLAKKTYNGWHFAKIVLLFKIISHELNMIETWRYHPGLTTNFMLNLETKLSQHYTDLAKIFKDHPFIEQEFWLTAFYLNPTNYNYEAVKRLGMRSNRKRSDDQGRWVTGKDKIEAKYGLLSSTIDVKEITNLSNTEEQRKDYEPLFQALCSLHLPETMVKDIITVVFLARNKSFSWAVDWGDLRRRCKMLMSNANEKKRFVELNMAEANDRLKFLKIDYDKYKNRPQLDYGTIEQGYENLMNSADMDDDTEESEEEEDDFEDDEDVYETQKGRGNKKPAETIEDDNSQEDDPYLTGKRRTRARAAATMASFLFTSDLTTRRKRRKKDEDEATKENEEKLNDTEEKSNDSKSAESVDSLTSSAMEDANSKIVEIPKKNIKECLKKRPLFDNPTYGFQPLIDMWNIEKSDLELIDSDCVSLLESSNVLNRFARLKNINKEINPSAIKDEDQTGEMGMLTIYEDIAKQNKDEKMEATVSVLPAGNVPIKEEPADTEVPEQIAKSQDSQDTKQATQEKEKNIAKVDRPIVDQTDTEEAKVTEVEDRDAKSISENNDAKEEGAFADIHETEVMERNIEEKDDETSGENNENAEEECIAIEKQSNVMEINAEEEKDQNISEPNGENEMTTMVAILQSDVVERNVEEESEEMIAELNDENDDNEVDKGAEEKNKQISEPNDEDDNKVAKGAEEKYNKLPEVPIETDVEMETIEDTDEVGKNKTENTTALTIADVAQSPLMEKLLFEEENNKEDGAESSKISEVQTTDNRVLESPEIKDGNKVLESLEMKDLQNNDESPEIKEMSINKDNVVETLQLKEIQTDDDNVTESIEIEVIQTNDGKDPESTEAQVLQRNDDISNVISDDKTETASNETIYDTHINSEIFDMPLLDSEESNSLPESSANGKSNLKVLCLTKPLKVLIRKLRPSDLANLRQPKVRVKRIKNIEVFLEQFKAKRRRFDRKVYIDVEESSDNSLMSNSSSSDAYRPPKGSRTKPPLKRHTLRTIRTSESDCDSIKSHLNLKNRRLSTPNASSNQSNNSARSSSRPPTANLVVTPRSASGLKLRISHADQQSRILHGKSSLSSVDEIIQLSSSSNDTNTMDSIPEVIEIGEIADPLFEEEIVI